jgi:hypothetical protein
MTDATWQRVTLSCPCPAHIGPELAHDIQEHFHAHYPHEHAVTCVYSGGQLVLSSTNDYDPEGLNLSDEFSDVITANMPEHFEGDITFMSSERCEAPANDN